MRGGRGWRRWLGLTVSVIAVLAAIAHVIWPSARIDGTTALLLGVALIPWLGELLESIELPGGLKIKYRIAAVEASAREASSAAQAALGAAVSARDDVDELLVRLHELRSRAFPGRTEEMDRLFGALVNAVPDDFDVVRALGSSDDGQRLAGYAFAYSRAEPELIGPAEDALAHEENRFNQYWVLTAIRRIVVRNGARIVPGSLVDLLRSLAADLPEDSNRRHAITGLLDMVDND
jgi:hypothetical protein